jgi:hypothetical protein
MKRSLVGAQPKMLQINRKNKLTRILEQLGIVRLKLTDILVKSKMNSSGDLIKDIARDHYEIAPTLDCKEHTHQKIRIGWKE